MSRKTRLQLLNEEIVACRRCPRLTRYREEVARVKRRAYRDETYWGRPVPGFGDPCAWLVIVGLAPGAHGANRTGRIFTGDRSGDFLYSALYRAGIASQPTSKHRADGLELRGAYITAACRCAPPDNKPTPDEIANCASFLQREQDELPNARVFLALGAIGFRATLDLLQGCGHPLPVPKPKFDHGAEVAFGAALRVVESYHVSQQNTQTGRLTPAMSDTILRRCLELRR